MARWIVILVATGSFGAAFLAAQFVGVECITETDENQMAIDIITPPGTTLDGTIERFQVVENTIVVYTADQGFFLGEHGLYDKRIMYEEALRMPLLVRWPNRVRAGSVSDDMVLNVDFAPTILEIAGAEPVDGDIEIRGLTFFYGGERDRAPVPSLREVSLSIPRGSRVDGHALPCA